MKSYKLFAASMGACGWRAQIPGSSLTQKGKTMNTAEAVRKAITESRNTDALDLARDAIAADANADAADPEMLYLAGLASVRMGAFRQAHQWYARIDSSLVHDDQLLGDILCLEGRIFKHRFENLREVDPDRATVHALDSFMQYKRAFEAYGTPYAAINAATMAFLVGETEPARRFARLAIKASSAAVDDWACATRGEAYLLLGDAAAALEEYRAAYRMAHNRHGVIASIRQQLVLLGTPAALECLNEVPAARVIAFTGHMLDHPDRVCPRFDMSMVSEVAEALRARITEFGQAIGFSQAACGADILFLEAMQAAGMQTVVILPFAESDYLKTSVAFAGDDWVERHHRVMKGATQVILATAERYLGDDVLFEHAADLIQGMALLRARQLVTSPCLLTVEREGSATLPGGTVSTAARWSRRGWDIERILLKASVAPTQRAIAQPLAPPPPAYTPMRRTIQSFVFADVTGFSRMPEEYTPAFVDAFLSAVRRVMDGLRESPADANTRGDGLYFVFDSPYGAAEFAASLLAAVRSIDWLSLGLPSTTTVRIGLHTGPAYRTHDPVMNKATFYGSHVNRAARLEAIVRPGQIFTTESFAATLAAVSDTSFSCDYIGYMPLPKQFGVAALYRLATASHPEDFAF